MYRLVVRAENPTQLHIKLGEVLRKAGYQLTPINEGESNEKPDTRKPTRQLELPISKDKQAGKKRRGRPRKSPEATSEAASEPVSDNSERNSSESGDSWIETDSVSESSSVPLAAGQASRETTWEQESREESAVDTESDVASIVHDDGGNGVMETPAPVLTREDVLKAFQHVNMAFGVPACRSLLVMHGITRISELKEEDYAAFKAACDKRLNKGN